VREILYSYMGRWSYGEAAGRVPAFQKEEFSRGAACGIRYPAVWSVAPSV